MSTSVPVCTQTGDGNYTKFHNSVGQRPAYIATASASAYLFNRQLFPESSGCVGTCLTFAHLGNCAPTDDICLCNSQVYLGSIALCVGSACTRADFTSVEQAAESRCAAVGVTLTSLPTVPATTAAASSPATTSAASSSTIPASRVNASSSSAVSSLSSTTSSASTGHSTTSSTSVMTVSIASGSGRGMSATTIREIIGGVVGFVALLAILGFLWFYVTSRRKRALRAARGSTSRWGSGPNISAKYETIFTAGPPEEARTTTGRGRRITGGYNRLYMRTLDAVRL